MTALANRFRTKNEATGMRIVSQYVQEFWECGWQPLDARNDKGIDGLIFMRKKSQDLGVKINIQVKCGSKYISSVNKDEIRLSIHSQKELADHIEYWRSQSEPAILIYVNPSKPERDECGRILFDTKGQIVWKENRLNAKAWWVDLKSDNLRTPNSKTLISIPIRNVFGEHSKGAFYRLVKPLLSYSNLPLLTLDSDSKNLLTSQTLKQDARKIYKKWKDEECFCKALSKSIRVSKTGWKHILSSSRGKQRRLVSLRLIGVAKQVVNEVEEGKYFLLNQNETAYEVEQKIGIRARYIDKMLGEQIVQVIILRKFNRLNKREKLWFYSVHYRR